MKLPGPDHPITIEPNPKRVRVRVGGVPVADTSRALTLREASYPAVQYVPMEDVAPGVLVRSSRTTHCPYKGEASYWDLRTGGTDSPAAVWGYEAPFPAVSAIAGHVAFYPDRVTIEEVD